MRLLERDVGTGVLKGEKIQGGCCLLLVWVGKLAVRLMKRDVFTGIWRGE